MPLGTAECARELRIATLEQLDDERFDLAGETLPAAGPPPRTPGHQVADDLLHPEAGNVAEPL